MVANSKWIQSQLRIIRRIRDLKERNRALCALNHRLEERGSFIDVFQYSSVLNRVSPSYNPAKGHSRTRLVSTLPVTPIRYGFSSPAFPMPNRGD